MRGKQISRRKLTPDAKYQSELVAKLINFVMQDGKKSTATALVYQAMDKAANETKASALDVLQQAIVNVTPKLEVRGRRVGGANYQVPMPVGPHRGQMLSIRWLVNATRDRKGKDFATLFADEIVAAYNNTGTAVKKREDTERMAEANRAFAQFRW